MIILQKYEVKQYLMRNTTIYFIMLKPSKKSYQTSGFMNESHP